MFLKPDIVLNSVTEINLKLLENYGIKGLLLDLDNTLTTHNNPVPSDGIMEWLGEMKRSGISLMIVSNNYINRVKPFSRELGLRFVPASAKPLSYGIDRARKRLRLEKKEIAMVGDQLYTDVLGGNLYGIKTIFVFPIQHEDGILFKMKRIAEKPFLPKISRK